MRLKFVFGGVEHSVNTIMEFIKDGNTNFWNEPFFHFYPDIEKDRGVQCQTMKNINF